MLIMIIVPKLQFRKVSTDMEKFREIYPTNSKQWLAIIYMALLAANDICWWISFLNILLPGNLINDLIVHLVNVI